MTFQQRHRSQGRFSPVASRRGANQPDAGAAARSFAGRRRPSFRHGPLPPGRLPGAAAGAASAGGRRAADRHPHRRAGRVADDVATAMLAKKEELERLDWFAPAAGRRRARASGIRPRRKRTNSAAPSHSRVSSSKPPKTAANMTDDDVRTAITAGVRDGLLRLADDDQAGPNLPAQGPAAPGVLRGAQVAAVPSSASRVRELLEAELLPLPFDSFDDTPLASTSLGQVVPCTTARRSRSARRAGGDVRPGLQEHSLGAQMNTWSAAQEGSAAARQGQGRRSRLDVVRGRRGPAAHEEIDYINEGRNAEQFAASLVGTGSRWWCRRCSTR